MVAFLVLAGAAVMGAALAIGWAIRQQPKVVIVYPDTTAVALFPVCLDGPVKYFPAAVRRNPP